MREFQRIKRILKLIEELWTKSPDQRFGQLLINQNVIPDNMYSWTMEDDELEKQLNLQILEEQKAEFTIPQLKKEIESKPKKEYPTLRKYLLGKNRRKTMSRRIWR